MTYRHLASALLLAAGLGGLASSALAQTSSGSTETPAASSSGSIGLPPSIRDEAAGKAAGAGKAKKPPARSGSGERSTAAASRNAAQAGTAPARGTSPGTVRGRETDEGASGAGLPRFQPTLDPSSGRLGLGGRF